MPFLFRATAPIRIILVSGLFLIPIRFCFVPLIKTAIAIRSDRKKFFSPCPPKELNTDFQEHNFECQPHNIYVTCQASSLITSIVALAYYISTTNYNRILSELTILNKSYTLSSQVLYSLVRDRYYVLLVLKVLPTKRQGQVAFEYACMTSQLHPLVAPHVSHFSQVPLRIMVKFWHSEQELPV